MISDTIEARIPAAWRGSVPSWRERIVAARERGAFTEEDLELARDWATCALGEQQARLPELAEALDLDERAFMAGARLPAYVISNDFAKAERVVDAIEDRVLELKRGEPEPR